jgi:hypothetical protein
MNNAEHESDGLPVNAGGDLAQQVPPSFDPALLPSIPDLNPIQNGPAYDIPDPYSTSAPPPVPQSPFDNPVGDGQTYPEMNQNTDQVPPTISVPTEPLIE